MQVRVHVTASIRRAFVACLSAKHEMVMLVLQYVAEGHFPWVQYEHAFMQYH